MGKTEKELLGNDGTGDYPRKPSAHVPIESCIQWFAMISDTKNGLVEGPGLFGRKLVLKDKSEGRADAQDVQSKGEHHGAKQPESNAGTIMFGSPLHEITIPESSAGCSRKLRA